MTSAETTNTRKQTFKSEVDSMSRIMEIQKNIERTVVNTYNSIEHGVVNGYKTMETHVVSAYKKMESMFVDKFLTDSNK